MTIVGATASERSIRHPLLWAVVSLSLALNLFFVAGAVWTRLHAPLPLTRAERFDEMATALALNPQQRQSFARFSRSMHGQLVAMRQAASPLVRDAWAEVSRPQADETKIMRLLDAAAQLVSLPRPIGLLDFPSHRRPPGLCSMRSHSLPRERIQAMADHSGLFTTTPERAARKMLPSPGWRFSLS